MKFPYIAIAFILSLWSFDYGKAEVATTNNQLALKLYYHLAKNMDGDFLFSPFSLSSLISVLGSMAGEGTVERITGAMDYADDYESVTNDYKRILIEFQKLESLNETVLELQQKDDLKLSSDFKRLLVKYLFDIAPLKFSAGSGKTQSEEDNYLTTVLNLGNRTETEIDQLLQLKSTINFKGSWARPFNPISTKPSPFYNMSRRPYLVDMIEDPESRIELLVFLPNSLTGLNDLETKLVQQPFSLTLREFTGTKDLFVYMPKFKLRSELDLKAALRQVGLHSLFVSENSNFSKLFQGNVKPQSFGVLKTSHFGKFSVDEYGTNGWARGFLGSQPAITKHLSPDVFRVDRPFVGVLYDSTRHVVLLMFRKIDFESIDPNRIAIPDAFQAEQ
ncbi:Serpin A3-2 [Orchesella cincta]|uniref:Serpin A3-2 n=1 Tax=Orchesella cincta TaxID=48709 RepID=A0A1D2MRX2_ORCCI|nr:Serpin A3-2 [Orchesella cincta]